MKAFVWYKTSLNTGGVIEAGADPPSCKKSTFLGAWQNFYIFTNKWRKMAKTQTLKKIIQYKV